MPDGSELRRNLSTLVLRDPQAARRSLQNAISADFGVVDEMMGLLTETADTRLRQLVANVARTHDQKHCFAAHLLEWKERETDEFTRRAIDAALSAIEQAGAAAHTEPAAQTKVRDRDLFEAYGFVSARLKHRIRNAMLPAQGNLAKLREILDASEVREATTVIAKLVDAIKSIGRELEATDVDPVYFEERTVDLVAWLKGMNVTFAATYPNLPVILTTSSDKSMAVRGSSYLLETLFWNLWLDAAQNVAPPCRVYVEVFRRGGNVELTLLDNGDGFPETMKDIAFQVSYSSKSASRGRGLLEAADAVARMGGNIHLTRCQTGDLRIRITLPVFAPK
jgi:signal transduction histidine kinase